MNAERLQKPENTQSDAACRHCADVHALNVVGARHAIGDVPTAFKNPVVGRDVVAHEREHLHHDVLGDADGIAVRYFRDRNTAIHGRLKVGVIGADAGRHNHFELGRLGNALGGHVGRPERLRDHDLGVVELLVELGILAVLVGRDDERMAGRLEILAQSQLAGHAAQQCAWLEVDGRGRGRGLPIRILGDLWDVVTGICLRITVDRVIVQNATPPWMEVLLLCGDEGTFQLTVATYNR